MGTRRALRLVMTQKIAQGLQEKARQKVAAGKQGGKAVEVIIRLQKGVTEAREEDALTGE